MFLSNNLKPYTSGRASQRGHNLAQPELIKTGVVPIMILGFTCSYVLSSAYMYLFFFFLNQKKL